VGLERIVSLSAPLGIAVEVVVPLSAKEKMFRIDTRRIVALV
jgi:hypothetical protein